MLSFGIFVSGSKMIYCIRHGQTDWNSEKRMQGITDIPLNDRGIFEARLAAKEVSKIKWDRIISSPLSRACQTAEILNQRIGLQIETDERLAELNLGNLEGKSLSLLTPRMWEILGKEPQKIKAEGLPAAYDRIDDFMRALDFSKNTLIITHSGLFRAIAYYMQNPNGFNYDAFSPRYRDLGIPNTTLIPVKPIDLDFLRGMKYNTQNSKG